MVEQINIPYARPMRDERYVLTIAAALSMRLRTEVACIQGPRYTEWRVGDRGFAVGPNPGVYPPKQLVETLVKYFSPPMPAPTKRETNADDPQARTDPGKRVRRGNTRGG